MSSPTRGKLFVGNTRSGRSGSDRHTDEQVGNVQPEEQAASRAADASGESLGRSADERLIGTQEAARLLGMTKRGVQLAAERGLIAFELQQVGLGFQRRYV